MACSNGQCTCEALLQKLFPKFKAATSPSPVEEVARYRLYIRKDGKKPTKSSARRTWLQAELFKQGKQLYCTAAICAVFNVSKTTLHYWRKQQPAGRETMDGFVRFTAANVLRQKLVQSVVVPSTCAADPSDYKSIVNWLNSLPPEELVRYDDAVLVSLHISAFFDANVVPLSIRRLDVLSTSPGSLHGLKGRTSNSSKEREILPAMLSFLDEHSTPNGRSGSCSGPTRYLSPVITSWHHSRKPEDEALVPDWEERTQNTFLARFNKYQTEKGGCTISTGTLSRYRNTFPVLRVYGICPMQSDYCDTCSTYRAQIKSLDKRIQLLQENSQDPRDMETLAVQREGYASLLEGHVKEATEDLNVHHTLGKKCRAQYDCALAVSGATRTALLQETPLMLAIDFKQTIGLPKWGQRQPGTTFYKRNYSVHCLGICNLTTGQNALCFADEVTVGYKDTNHVLSFLEAYLSKRVDDCHKHLILAVDGAAYFKNSTIIAWASEQVRKKRFNKVTLRWLVVGHTKFEPDQLFSSVSARLKQHELVNVDEIMRRVESLALMSLVLKATHSPSTDLCAVQMKDFKGSLSQAYGKLKGIQSHAVICISVNPAGPPLVQCKSQGHTDATHFETVTFGMKRGVEAADEPLTFWETGRQTGSRFVKAPDKQKMIDLIDIYSAHIGDKSRWPQFVRRYYEQGPANFYRTYGEATEVAIEEPTDAASCVIEADPALKKLAQIDNERVRVMWARAFSGKDEDHPARLQLIRAHLLIRMQPLCTTEQVLDAMDNDLVGVRGTPRSLSRRSRASGTEQRASSTAEVIPPLDVQEETPQQSLMSVQEADGASLPRKRPLELPSGDAELPDDDLSLLADSADSVDALARSPTLSSTVRAISRGEFALGKRSRKRRRMFGE